VSQINNTELQTQPAEELDDLDIEIEEVEAQDMPNTIWDVET
jgi:hypothetical protein